MNDQDKLDNADQASENREDLMHKGDVPWYYRPIGLRISAALFAITIVLMAFDGHFFYRPGLLEVCAGVGLAWCVRRLYWRVWKSIVIAQVIAYKNAPSFIAWYLPTSSARFQFREQFSMMGLLFGGMFVSILVTYVLSAIAPSLQWPLVSSCPFRAHHDAMPPFFSMFMSYWFSGLFLCSTHIARWYETLPD